MNPMSIMASAEKLSVPELQRSIQSGVIPAFIGVPLLQEKVKRAKQMQMGMAAQQPKRPSVAEQVGQEARQASVEDMMRERARTMQDEMGQTGGISDFLPKPAEEAYAKGGPIAFRDEGYVNPDFLDAASDMDFDTWRRRQGIPGGQLPFSEDQLPQSGARATMPSAALYGSDLGIDEATALRALTPEQLNYYSTLPNGKEAAIGAGRKIMQQAVPQRYRNVLPTEDITTDKTTNVPYYKSEAPVKTPYASDMPEMQVLTKKILDRQAKPIDAKPQRYRNIATDEVTAVPKALDVVAPQPQQVTPQVAPLQKQPAVIVPTGQPAPVIGKAELVKPQIGGADQRTMAERMQLRPTQVDRTAPSRTPHEQALQPSAPAVGAGAPPAQQAQPQQQQEERDQSLSDYMKQYREAAGENKGIGALQNRLSEREARLAKEEDRAPWLALMQAGLATMAGTSPNAMANIGQGGVAGLQAYTRSMNKLEDAKDKSFDIQAKLEDAQRSEELAGVKYGIDSIKTDKAAKRASDLQAQKDKNDMDIAKLRDATDGAQLAITARNANRPNEGTFQQALFDDLVAHGASKADAAKQVLSAGRPYGAGNTFKTGVELRALVDDSQKRLDDYVKNLGFRAKQPNFLAADETYKQLLAARNDAAAAHKQYIAANSSYLGGQGTVTPPPAGGVSSGGDGWGQVQVK